VPGNNAMPFFSPLVLFQIQRPYLVLYFQIYHPSIYRSSSYSAGFTGKSQQGALTNRRSLRSHGTFGAFSLFLSRKRDDTATPEREPLPALLANTQLEVGTCHFPSLESPWMESS